MYKTISDIHQKLMDIYLAKNEDYGDSFNKSLDKYGLIASIVRMEDKFNRLSNLINIKEYKVEESLEDTLLDLANYAIMTIAYLKNKEI